MPEAKKMKNRWIPNVLVIMVVLYFGVSGLSSLWKARVDPGPTIEPLPVKASIGMPGTIRPLDQYSIVAERNLFGGSDEDIPPPEEEFSLDNLPLALKSLGLQLVGTVVAEESNQNVAYIRDTRSRKEEPYREGDKVKKANIKKIVRNNVIITTGRGDEVLTMEFRENEADRKTQAAAGRQGRRGRRTATGTGGAVRLSRDEIESSLADLNQLMKEVRIRPYMEGKKPAGFLLSGIKPNSLFSKMGLRNGDVVKSVNDVSITSPDQAIEFYESLSEGGEIALEVKNRGRIRKFTVEIE